MFLGSKHLLTGCPRKPIDWSTSNFPIQVYGARSTIIDNIASDIRPLDFRPIQVTGFGWFFSMAI